LGGVQVIDIASPEDPTVVGSVDTPGSAVSVSVSDAHAYVADASSGLQVLSAQCESSGVAEHDGIASRVLLRILTSPSSHQVVIRFESRRGGSIQANVYDPAGRRIRGLLDGISTAGVHDWVWDGRDQSGSAVAAGIYLVRVSAAEGTAIGRVAVVR
jgi:flagellar hook assembly protein FlgD